MSIILFGLRMIRLFNQPLNISNEFQKVLINKEAQVQMELCRLLAVNNKCINKELEIITKEVDVSGAGDSFFAEVINIYIKYNLLTISSFNLVQRD